MTLRELKQEKETRFSALIKAVGMFFAFSNKQWDENKTPLNGEGDKYIETFGGAYMPKSNLAKWEAGTAEINAWFSQAIETHNLRRSHIAYELSNHESYYTGEIDQALSALGEGYTAEEVLKVYREEAVNQE